MQGASISERPQQTYINKICQDTGLQPKELPAAMRDRTVLRTPAN